MSVVKKMQFAMILFACLACFFNKAFYKALPIVEIVPSLIESGGSRKTARNHWAPVR